MKRIIYRSYSLLPIVLLLFVLTGCGALVSKATQPFADNLTNSVMKQNDPEMVRDGMPTLILIIDAFVEGRPKDAKSLTAAAQLYSSYNSAFIAGTDPERSKVLTDKALGYAVRAMSEHNACFRENHGKPFAQFEPCGKTFQKKDVPLLFVVIGAWAGWVQAHSDNWDSVADISKIRLMVERLIDLDDQYFYGSPHLYLGVLDTILPAQIGGKIEEGRAEFEKALKISRGKMLAMHVMYAKQVALPTLDQDLFNRLMDHVEKTPADVAPELTLLNTIAKRDAEKLKADAKTYFDSRE